MPTVTIDISGDDDKEPAVEFGLLSTSVYGTNVQIMFNELTLETSYEQAENLYKQLKPFFEIEEEEEAARI